MLVFIGKLSWSTLRWVPICQGFSQFSGFLHHFVLAKLATSSTRVNFLLAISVQLFFSYLGLQVCCSFLGTCYDDVRHAISKLRGTASVTLTHPEKVNFTSLSSLPMLRLLSSKSQGRKDFWKPSKTCHVGIHWIALTECSQMSTHMTGFQSFFSFFVSFCNGKIVKIVSNLLASSTWACFAE